MLQQVSTCVACLQYNLSLSACKHITLFDYYITSIHCRSVTTEYVAICDNFVCIVSFRCLIDQLLETDAAIVVLSQLCMYPMPHAVRMHQLLHFFYCISLIRHRSIHWCQLSYWCSVYLRAATSRAALILRIHVAMCYMFVNIIDLLYLLHLIYCCSVYLILRAALFWSLCRFASHLFEGGDDSRMVSC